MNPNTLLADSEGFENTGNLFPSRFFQSDVEEWRWNLKAQELADGTVYNRISAWS